MSDEPTDATTGADTIDGDAVGGGSGSLRSAAFLCTVIAGLLVGLGALLTWVTFGLSDPNAATLDQVYKGIDLTDRRRRGGRGIRRRDDPDLRVQPRESVRR